MSTDEYVGPVIGVVSEPENPQHWQYALREVGGELIELDGTPRFVGQRMYRRPMVPAGPWRKVHDVDL